jgi:hypothetical protein
MKIALVSVLLSIVLSPRVSRAETLQAPEGGRHFSLGKNRVVCGAMPEGWGASADRHSVRPPEVATSSNRTIEIRVSTESSDCQRYAATITLNATSPWPDIDPSSVNFYPDEGRLDFKGSQLERVQVLWLAGNRSGQQTCITPTPVGKTQQCVIPLERKLPSNAVLEWFPGFAQTGDDVTTFDAQGRQAGATAFTLQPGKTVLGQVFTPVESLDVSQGFGLVPLAHPEALASADCTLARCELGSDGVQVHSVPGQATQITVTARLSPGFAISRGDHLESSATASFTLVRCPLALVSGPPIRDADEPGILVRVAERCQSDVRLHWTVGTESAEVIRSVRTSDGDYVLLRTGQLAGGSVTITATRADSTVSVVGTLTTPTMAPPRPQATLELPGHGPINFIPTNREARWLVGSVPHARLLPLDLPGAYTLRADKDRIFIRGEGSAGGFANLRMAYRRDDLPKGFDDVNLAVLTETVQRPLREASVPVSFWPTTANKEPIAEFLCANKKGKIQTIEPGKPARIPYTSRESCHVIIHQERILPEDGQQEIVLDIDVTKAGGAKRPEASMSERMVLRPGGTPRVFYLKGVTEQFDQIAVRLSHVVDESRYVLGTGSKQTPPSTQWSAVVEGGRIRLYVSLNVPAGLYRMNEPAASLSLNFGVLGRLTWLGHDGKEGLLGLETGVLGASLIPQQYNGNPAFPPTLLTLFGAGLRVEIGQGAAVGVHLWGAYEFRNEYQYSANPSVSPALTRTATHWSLLFGPSISIGNVGTNL